MELLAGLNVSHSNSPLIAMSLHLRYKQLDKTNRDSLVVTSNLPDLVSRLCNEHMTGCPGWKIKEMSKRIPDMLSDGNDWPRTSNNTGGKYVSARQVTLDPSWDGESELKPFYRALFQESRKVEEMFENISKQRPRAQELYNTVLSSDLTRKQRRAMKANERRSGSKMNEPFPYSIAQECLTGYMRELCNLTRSTLDDFKDNRDEQEANAYYCDIFSGTSLTVDRFQELCAPGSVWHSAFNGVRWQAKSKDALTKTAIVKSTIRLAAFINDKLDGTLLLDVENLKRTLDSFTNAPVDAQTKAGEYRNRLRINCETSGKSYDRISHMSFKELAMDAFCELTGYASLQHMRVMKTMELVTEVEMERLKRQQAQTQLQKGSRVGSEATSDSHFQADDEATLVGDSASTLSASFTSETPSIVVESSELHTLLPSYDPNDSRWQTVSQSSTHKASTCTKGSGSERDFQRQRHRDKSNTYTAIIQRDEGRRAAIGQDVKPSTWAKPRERSLSIIPQLDRSLAIMREWSADDMKKLKGRMCAYEGLDESFYDELVRHLAGSSESGTGTGIGQGAEWFPRLQSISGGTREGMEEEEEEEATQSGLCGVYTQYS